MDSKTGVSHVLVDGSSASKATTNHNAANVTAPVQAVANGLSSKVQVSPAPTPDITITGSVTDTTPLDSPPLPPPPSPPPPLSPPPLPPPPSPPSLPPPPSTTPSPQQNESTGEQAGDEDTQLDTDHGDQNAPRVTTDSAIIDKYPMVVGGEGKVEGATDSDNRSSGKLSDERETEKSMEMTSSMALAKRAEGFIKQVEESEAFDSTPIFEMSMTAAETTPADSKATELPSSHEENQGEKEEENLTSVEDKHQPSEVVESGQKEGVVKSGSNSNQESAGGNVVEENDFWFETAQILGECGRVHIGALTGILAGLV